MKPKWEDAPSWANWLAMNEDGFWFWYAEKPDPNFGSWRHGGRLSLAARPDHDYVDTVERRP